MSNILFVLFFFLFSVMLFLQKMYLLLYIKKTCFFIPGVCPLLILNINLLEWKLRNLNSIPVPYELIANLKLYAMAI